GWATLESRPAGSSGRPHRRGSNSEVNGQRGNQPNPPRIAGGSMASHRPSLSELEDAGAFARRHIGPTPEEVATMLAAVGAASIEELIAQTVPALIRTAAPLALLAGVSVPEALARLRRLAARNTVVTSMI